MTEIGIKKYKFRKSTITAHKGGVGGVIPVKTQVKRFLGSSTVDMQALFMGNGSLETAEWRRPLCCPARSAAESDWTAPPAPGTAGQSCG